jgi:HlyD family secretion protein
MESMKRKKKQRSRTIRNAGALLLIITVLAGLIYSAFFPRAILVEVARVERKTFHEVIRSDGILRSKDRFVVPAFAEGDIRRVDLKVGDTVRKGETITELFWDVRYEPVKSPIDGVVSKIFRESAGPIRRGEPIVEVINPHRLEVVAELLTGDAIRVAPGNPAKIENWGGKEPLSAIVTRVSQAGFVKVSALGVEEERTEVSMNLENVPEAIMSHLGSTFHVDVEIEISTAPNALVLPEGALFREGADWAVFLVKNGRAVKTTVSILARGAGNARIGSEVSEDDSVILYPGDLVKDGSRVRVQGH